MGDDAIAVDLQYARETVLHDRRRLLTAQGCNVLQTSVQLCLQQVA